MTYSSNGYLVQQLLTIQATPNHQDCHLASELLTTYRAMEQIFFNEVHPDVDTGLAISESLNAHEGPMHIFTKHGSPHVSDVIKSLDKLGKSLAEQNHNLTATEIYILLCAAHVHDAANVMSRKGHATNSNEIIRDYQSHFYDSPTIQNIYNVASAHGGKDPQYGSDTIRRLEANNLTPPRLSLLAAMLKLADELSESPSRVPALVAKHHQHSPESQLAFHYAKCFGPFELRQDTLYILYNIYPSSEQFQVPGQTDQLTFIDFLEQKLNVIDKEARYCTQYGKPALWISRISATFRLYHQEIPSPLKKEVKLTWSLSQGYPDESPPVSQRSPEFAESGASTLQALLSGTQSTPR